jgi:hypothetical protein
MRLTQFDRIPLTFLAIQFYGGAKVASMKLWKKGGVPVGFYTHLTWNEACLFTEVAAPFIVSQLAAGASAKPWMAIIAAAIAVQSSWIKAKNENSKHAGVRLRFNALKGFIDGIKRKDKGSSPCGQVSVPQGQDRSNTVDVSALTATNVRRLIENFQVLEWAGQDPVTAADPSPATIRRFHRQYPQARQILDDLMMEGVIRRPRRPRGPVGPRRSRGGD